MAFGPFLGGRRVCLGKSFAITSARYVTSMIFDNFEFEHLNPELCFTKPKYNIWLTQKPTIMMKIIKRKKGDMTA